MIVFDLSCDSGHRFEGWFGSSADFEQQQENGLVSCPQCGSQDIEKAPMAPSVPRKGSHEPAARRQQDEVRQEGDNEPQAMTRGPLPPEITRALERLAAAQRRALRDSTWVGPEFAERSRAMHYGEREAEAIHGQASVEDARSLIDEGISIAPLPFPIATPEDIN